MVLTRFPGWLSLRHVTKPQYSKQLRCFLWKSVSAIRRYAWMNSVYVLGLLQAVSKINVIKTHIYVTETPKEAGVCTKYGILGYDEVSPIWTQENASEATSFVIHDCMMFLVAYALHCDWRISIEETSIPISHVHDAFFAITCPGSTDTQPAEKIRAWSYMGLARCIRYNMRSLVWIL